MMSLAHSLHGNKATYIVQPFTSAEFLFMMAFSSAWHTAGANEKKRKTETAAHEEFINSVEAFHSPSEITYNRLHLKKKLIRNKVLRILNEGHVV